MVIVRVREALVSDAVAIARVHVRAWREGYRGIVSERFLLGLTVCDRAERWRRLLGATEPSGQTFVAVAPDRVIRGFCSAAVSGRDTDAKGGVGEIRALYVEPACWRRGIGATLLRHACCHLVAEGCYEATLWVFEESAQGRAFYTRLGFGPDGAEAVHEATGQREIRLRAGLSGTRES